MQAPGAAREASGLAGKAPDSPAVMRSASGCDLAGIRTRKAYVDFGSATLSTALCTQSAPVPNEANAKLHPDAACDGGQGIGPSFRLSGNTACFYRVRLPASSLSTVEGNRLGSWIHSRNKEHRYDGLHGAG